MFKLFSESGLKKNNFNGQSKFEERQMKLHNELLLQTLRASLTNTPQYSLICFLYSNRMLNETLLYASQMTARTHDTSVPRWRRQKTRYFLGSLHGVTGRQEFFVCDKWALGKLGCQSYLKHVLFNGLAHQDCTWAWACLGFRITHLGVSVAHYWESQGALKSQSPSSCTNRFRPLFIIQLFNYCLQFFKLILSNLILREIW